MSPQRIQRQRTKGWRMPEGAVYVGRPTRWGNPFAYRTPYALARVPGALSGEAWEYEGRVSGDGARHDYHHPDGHVTVCHIRYMTRGEVVETYRRALLRDFTPAMLAASPSGYWLRVTRRNVELELAGKDLVCWCPLDQPCHADVLLELANAPAVTG